MKSKREALSTSRKNKNKITNINQVSTIQDSTLQSSANLFKSMSISSRPKVNLIGSNSSNFFPHEESVEIKIPTPYPQSKYMVIEDPALLNSDYTKLLNEKFPPRKFLRHNLTSWMKMNKVKANRDINVKFLNPKIKFEDFNLKKLTYRGEDIDNGNINSLEDALNIIEMLKAKIIEYELTNNNNIDTSLNYINSLKEENEFYINKLRDNYEKLNYISEKYNIDEVHDLMNDSNTVLINSFREKSLKKKFLYNLRNILNRNRLFVQNLNHLREKKENFLRFGAFLALEKNYMIKKFRDKITTKRFLLNIRKIYDSLRYNVYINKITQNFQNIRKTIILMVYMKELKINVWNSHYFKSINKKGLFKYYLSLTSKAILALRQNSLKFKQRKPNKINYLKFFQDFKGLSENAENVLLNKSAKTKKVKALNKLKNLMEKIIEKETNKIINHKNKHYPTQVYYKKWREITFLASKELQYKTNLRIRLISLFLHKVKTKIFAKTFKVIENMKQFYYKKFISESRKRLMNKIRNKIFKRKKQKLYYRGFINELIKLICNNPVIRYQKLNKKIQISTFIDNIRNKIRSRSNNMRLDKIEKRTKNILDRKMKENDILLFFQQVKRHILVRKKRKFLINLVKKKFSILYNLNKFRSICLMRKLKKDKVKNEKIISDIRIIIEEKAEWINKIELDNQELQIHYENIYSSNKSLVEENELLRRKIGTLETKSESDNKKFKELWNQNLTDIKYLQETLQNNEVLLSQAIKREEKLQHKYCVDVQNAIKLNKQLNTIISQKNKAIADIKIKQCKNDQISVNEQKKLYKENASLFNDYAKIIEIKEKEKKLLAEEKNRIIDKANYFLDGLEEEKMKCDYKVEMLKSDNKQLFNNLLSEIKKKK